MKNIIVILILLVIVGGISYYVGKNQVPINNVEDVKNTNNVSPNNNLSLFKNDDLSFTYPSNWKLETYGTKTDKFVSVILDPVKVYSPQIQVDMPLGMIAISVNHDSSEKNSFVIGYETFPNVTIGKNNNVVAKEFDKLYPDNAPEVSLQGKHNITYYINENIKIEYVGNKDDSYLKDFNQIISSLELK